jgi:hypothetical protein
LEPRVKAITAVRDLALFLQIVVVEAVVGPVLSVGMLLHLALGVLVGQERPIL